MRRAPILNRCPESTYPQCHEGGPKASLLLRGFLYFEIRNVASSPRSCALEMAWQSVFLHAVGHIARLSAGPRFPLPAFHGGTPRDAVDLPSRPRRQYCRAPRTDAARAIAA